jgi:hypothetical protein
MIETRPLHLHPYIYRTLFCDRSCISELVAKIYNCHCRQNRDDVPVTLFGSNPVTGCQCFLLLSLLIWVDARILHLNRLHSSSTKLRIGPSYSTQYNLCSWNRVFKLPTNQCMSVGYPHSCSVNAVNFINVMSVCAHCLIMWFVWTFPEINCYSFVMFRLHTLKFCTK